MRHIDDRFRLPAISDSILLFSGQYAILTRYKQQPTYLDGSACRLM